MWWLVLLACGSDPVGQPDPDGSPDPSTSSEEAQPTETSDVEPVMLSAVEQLNRTSMALRGIRPSIEELDAVAASADALPGIVDGYLQSDHFGATIRDLYAETLRIRWEGMALPANGDLEGTDMVDIFTSMSEEPLRLIEHIVMSDLPLTDALIVDQVFVDEVASLMYGFQTYDDGSGGVQSLQWEDERPRAGFLSANALWIRHASNGSNYHRARANLLADALLCEDFLSRDVPITGTVDLSDDAAVAEAVSTLPECVSCHQALDPLAAHLWGFKKQTESGQVANAYMMGCTGPGNDCYPLTGQYTEDKTGEWRMRDLRGPSYYGQESSDLTDLGGLVADDPRFSLCTAQRFYAFMGGVGLDEIPLATAAELQSTFIDSGFDAKALARAVVLHPDFLTASSPDPEVDATLPGLLAVTPEQHARMIEDLTGFRWLSDTDAESLRCNRCWGEIDRSLNNGYGFHAMSGGTDGYRITRSVDTITPIKVLFASALAEEAAAAVIIADFDEGASRLLGDVEGLTAEAEIRDVLSGVFRRTLGVEATEADVDGLYALYAGAFSRSGDRREGWSVAIAALLQHPRILFY